MAALRGIPSPVSGIINARTEVGSHQGGKAQAVSEKHSDSSTVLGDVVGKTVAGVSERLLYGRDLTGTVWLSWTEVTLSFTDGTSAAFNLLDAEVDLSTVTSISPDPFVAS